MNINTIARLVAACMPLASFAGASPAAGQATFRAVYYMQAYNQPAGLIEGSPGTFYSVAGGGNAVIFSVTTQGTVSYLATFQNPPYILLSRLTSAANDLFYSSLETGISAFNVVSVGSTSGSLHTYPANNYAPLFAQNLPDGTLLGYNTAQLVKSDLGGNVALVYQFPTNNRPEPPIYATDGNYYGAVGISPDASGYAYRLSPSGSLTQLYSFPAYSFDNSWYASVLEGTDGNFYGTTPSGGVNGYGTIYKLTPSGQYTLLYTFPKSGAGIPGQLIEASDGKLYGSVGEGSGNSLLFSITKSGHYNVVYRMSSQITDGQCGCWLVQGSDGLVYGTAAYGGTYGAGVIFALDAGLPNPKPRAQHFQPKSGAIGTRVRIWGYNLLSAAVQFNGVPATTVSNGGPNYIWATVPLGATTGPITVTTPGGTVMTKTAFKVQ